ncbi:hypothetical protein ISG33_02840 [Glaciecola sp. MH2013]|uniref:hypothetical protein n=1 Tax=Glaciecola sp. MH2013 TaxID=2785524 RepID=UPI0018A121D1|nr:hypothetical protein [Glaciecola sp. MH2013]MBF7072339.1 hypothetical protein [Glaciecola sp. MH2013]
MQFVNSLLLTCVLFFSSDKVAFAQVHHQVDAIFQAGVAASDAQKSFLESGTGSLRSNRGGLRWQQAIVQIESDWSSSFSSEVMLNGYSDGHKHLGLSQAFLKYQPIISSRVKYRLRLGMFYPELSVENTDIGWLSPDSYTHSAINSWFGEELRIFGIEASVFQGGRKRASAWSWDAKLGLYKGNDPLGSVIAWRGFSSHDRQSLFAERLEFAPYPSVISPEVIDHPAWVEPFSELDSRVGAYLGLHLRYLRRTQIKYYYYDNFANPNSVNSQRLYAWRTKFHSIAVQHQVNKSLAFKAQILGGSTLMGENFVHVDYQAAFAQILLQLTKRSKVSTRVDVFDVNERDIIPEDPNNSHGSALTLNYKYALTDSISIGSELHLSKNRAVNRLQLNIAPSQTEKAALVILEYRY